MEACLRALEEMGEGKGKETLGEGEVKKGKNGRARRVNEAASGKEARDEEEVKEETEVERLDESVTQCEAEIQLR